MTPESAPIFPGSPADPMAGPRGAAQGVASRITAGRTAVVGAEDLVDPQPEHLGDREGQPQRRVVLAVLNGDDRLPRHPQRLAELRLGPAPLPAQAPHTVPHGRPPAGQK